MRAEIHRVFESVDVIVTPTTPIPAPKIADLKQKPELLRPHELMLSEEHASLQRLGRRRQSPSPADSLATACRSACKSPPPRSARIILLQFAHACEQVLGWKEKMRGGPRIHS